MPENEIKSELSVAYVHAVVSRLGCACQITGRSVDNMGIDLILKFRGTFDSIGYRNITLDVQVKSTASTLKYDSQGRIILDGTSSAVYNDFCEKNRSPSAIIILFVLPDNPDGWVHQDEEHLLMRRCAYWVSLWGAEECKKDTKRIFIPKTQLFCVEQLRDKILMILAKGEKLRYAK